MNTSRFDLDKTGAIKVAVIVNYGLAGTPDGRAVLRVEYVETPEDFYAKNIKNMQFDMPPALIKQMVADFQSLSG